MCKQEAAPVAGQFLRGWTKSLHCSRRSFPGSGALAARAAPGGMNKQQLLRLCGKLLDKEGESSPGVVSGAKESSSACFTWGFGVEEAAAFLACSL